MLRAGQSCFPGFLVARVPPISSVTLHRPEPPPSVLQGRGYHKDKNPGSWWVPPIVTVFSWPDSCQGPVPALYQCVDFLLKFSCIFFFFSPIFHVCCMYAHACMCMCMWVEVGIPPRLLFSTLFTEAGSFTQTPSSPTSLVWLASLLWGSSSTV